MKENNQNSKDKRVPKYKVKTSYPFCPYRIGAVIQPIGELLKECKKFPHIFEDITEKYTIIEQKEGKIISVERLKDSQIFKIGDTVEYFLDHVQEKILFTISGFDPEENNLILCWSSKKFTKEYARAVGINLPEVHYKQIHGIKYKWLT